MAHIPTPSSRLIRETQEPETRPLALVCGIGDVGSAVAWMLFKLADMRVVIQEDRTPHTIRREMAFCDAIWEGQKRLEGVDSLRVDRLEDVLGCVSSQQVIAVNSAPFEEVLEALNPDVIVDARIQKNVEVKSIKDLAPISIGVGPGFEAGQSCDLVIESCWGQELGDIVAEGQALAPVPEPPKLQGIGWERFLRASESGRFQTRHRIGDPVEAGEVVAYVNTTPLRAPLGGHIRGILRTGLSVLAGEKLCEIDPRGKEARFQGLAERPKKIAAGVIEAIERMGERQSSKGTA